MRSLTESLRSLRHDPGNWVAAHRDGTLQLIKISLAAAVSWQIAARFLSDATPVLGPLTAVLTVQFTVYRTVQTALQRAAGVMVGVLLALGAAALLGLHAWSIGVMTAVALLAGQAMQLREQSVEVAVSALLVLAVGSQTPHYAEARVLETVLGAAVGIVVNLVFVPPVYVRSADSSLATLAHTAAALLDDIGHGLAGEWDRHRAQAWLDRARHLGELTLDAGAALAAAEESLRYNPRRGRAPGSLQHVRAAAAALDHVTSQMRTVARTLSDLADAPAGGAERPHLDAAFADAMVAAGEAMRRFGDAVGDPLAETRPEHVAALSETLATARTKHEAALAAMKVDPHRDATAWSVNASLLASTGRLLREIDPDDGPHAEAVQPSPPATTMQVLRSASAERARRWRERRGAAPGRRAEDLEAGQGRRRR